MTQIIDRGNKKWTSIMIPELREELRKVFADPQPERPELDEQEMERLNRLLTTAYHTGQPVRITYWADGEREMCGRIVWFEMGKVKLVGEDGKLHIDADRILDVRLLQKEAE